MYDIAIVGNGVLGYSIGFALIEANPHLRIAIIGPKDQRGAATTAAGAMLGCFGEVTKATRESEYARTKFKLSLKARDEWPSWLEAINDTHDKTLSLLNGTTILLNSASGKLDSENFEEIILALNENSEPYEEIDPLTIAGLNPRDTYRPLRAIHLPNEAAIDPLGLLRSLHMAVAKHSGVSLIDDVIHTVRSRANKVEELIARTGSIKADKYVFAAGVETQALIDQMPELANRVPRILSGVGCSLLLKYQQALEIRSVIRTPNRAGACGLNLMPRGKHLFLGASNNVSLKPECEARAGIVQFLIQCLLEQIDKNAHDAGIIQVQVGNRPMTVDTYPLLGRTSVDNLWLLTGTYRDGIHQSPLLARALAKDMLDGESHEGIAIFKPERLPLRTLPKEETIKEILLNYMSGAYEHSMQLPNIGWDDVVEQMFMNRIKEVYEALDTDLYVPPELMLMLDFERNRQKTIEYFKKYYRSYEQ